MKSAPHIVLERTDELMRPRLGVLAYWPIQYHSPLYQRLAERGNVDLDVLYLSDKGYRPAMDLEFGLPIAWDIDLLSGYKHRFMSIGGNKTSTARKIRTLTRWVPSHDAVVVNGYTSPWMLSAMGIARACGIPYLLRASSHPEGLSRGTRRHLRKGVTRAVVSASFCGLSMGQLNEQFYRQHHKRQVVFAPNSVDDERFAQAPSLGRSDLLSRLGLKSNLPLIMYCGKLYDGKRPLDLVAAGRLLQHKANMIFVGDGALAQQVRSSLDPANGVVTGFVNQSDLPAYYHAADILVLPSEIEMWGLVINEGMAAGTLPVVSDQVGCAPDLVTDVGEVYPCGDIHKLAMALDRALERVRNPQTRKQMQAHAARYSLERTAAGFEEAALAASRPR